MVGGWFLSLQDPTTVRWSKILQLVLCTFLVLCELLQCKCRRIWFVTFSLKKRSWRPGPEPEAATTPNKSTSYVCSSASLALPVTLLGLTYGRFSSLRPSAYPGTMLDSLFISDSFINKVLCQLSIICLCVVTFVLGVCARAGSENFLGTVDLVCFPSWKYPSVH